MPDPNPNPGPGNTGHPGNGADWRPALIGDDAAALEVLKPFEKPTDFFKSYQTLAGEVKTLKEKAPAFDFRKEIAGDDAEVAKELERFSTGKDVGKALLEGKKKIREGALVKPLAKNATAEQVAEWRAANGIPEKPEAYFEKLPNGRVIGKEDEPLFNEVAAKLHAKNASPEVVHELVEWYYGMQDAESAKQSDAEKQEAKAAEDALREAWGSDYRANENHLENYLAGLPEGLQKAFKEGFGGDGRKLMHNAEFKQWFANIAREFNPLGMVSPGGNETQLTNINTELANLQTLAGNQYSEYWKGPKAAQHQERMRVLLAQQDKLAARAK